MDNSEILTAAKERIKFVALSMGADPANIISIPVRDGTLIYLEKCGGVSLVVERKFANPLPMPLIDYGRTACLVEHSVDVVFLAPYAVCAVMDDGRLLLGEEHQEELRRLFAESVLDSRINLPQYG